jgi:hypothetical protein
MKLALTFTSITLAAILVGCGGGGGGSTPEDSTSSTSVAAGNSSSTTSSVSSQGSLDNTEFGDAISFNAIPEGLIVDCNNADDTQVLRFTFGSNIEGVGDLSEYVQLNGDIEVTEITDSDAFQYMFEANGDVLRLYVDPEHVSEGFYGKQSFQVTSSGNGFAPGATLSFDGTEICHITHILDFSSY